MAVFVDTSAFYALVDAADPNHEHAAGTLPALRGGVTHNYVVVEAATLVHRRLGTDATRILLEAILPVVEIVWIDRLLHDAAVSALLAAVRGRVSLVDWASFEVMRRRGIRTAFAFDRDFAVQGFETIP